MNLEEEFLRESNAIEKEYSDMALEDAKAAWSYARDNGEKIDLHYILEIHNILMKRLNPKIAGRIREVDLWVGHEKCLEPKQIYPSLYDWCFGMNDNLVDEEVIKQKHIRFLKIHPFEDGNGRTGRILMNIQRLNLGYPIKVIHIGKEQQEYYGWFK